MISEMESALMAQSTARLQEIQRLTDQLTMARETNKRLHRRCQDAEAAFPEYQKLTAMPPDGHGVKFVSGSFGRALLAAMCHTQQDEILALRAGLREAIEIMARGEQLLPAGKKRFQAILDGRSKDQEQKT